VIITLLAVLIGMLGTFLVLWPLSIRRMSMAQRPAFSRALWFSLGVPLLGLLVFFLGFGLAIQRSWLWGGVSVAITLALGALLLRHDQYSAGARILFDDYLRLKKENPTSSDFDLLYSIVKAHRPHWKEDRVMELCAGKDIRQLVLLLLVIEYEVHPLNDMRLYERLKVTVESMAPQ
jgi:hypothetical protein